MTLTVPFNALERIHRPLQAAMLAAVEGVMRSGQFILGPEVAEFEAALAQRCDTSHAVGVSSGTDALVAALLALEIGPGDEVITTPFTFFATAGAIHRVGAIPVFADIDAATFQLRAESVAARITAQTRAILPVHLFGQCADMSALEEVSRGAEIPLIEDAAQSIDAEDVRGRRAGTMGDLGCFSFFPAKNLGAMGDGGAVITSRDDLAAKLRALRVHGATQRNHHEWIGGNFRLDALQAAVLRIKLPHLDDWTAMRRANAQRYAELFAEADLQDRVRLPVERGRHVYNQYVVRISHRDALRTWLAEAGVSTGVYYPTPLHLQPCFRALGHRPGAFPEAEAAAAEVLALPIFPGITPAEIARVVERILAFFETEKDR